MVIDWSVKSDIEEELSRIMNADRTKLATDSVETEIVRNLHGRGTTRGFSFEYDEPGYVAGGGNRGPRPLEYFLAGWAFCQQVQYTRQALLSNTGFDGLRMVVSGDIDPLSILEMDRGGVPAGFVDDELSMTTHIKSDEADEDIQELASRAQEHCHAHASLLREMTINLDVYHNGEPLDL